MQCDVLIGLAYDAVLEPEAGWERFARALSEAFGRNPTCIQLRLPDADGCMGVATQLGGTAVDTMHRNDAIPWVIPTKVDTGASDWGLERIDIEQLFQSAFYADWLTPQACTGAGLGSLLRREGGEPIALVGAYESRHAARPLSTADRALLGALGPHLARAVRASHEVLAARRQAELRKRMLDFLRIAAFAVDGDGRILEMNRKAERLLSAGAAIRTERGRLVGASAAQGQRLRHAIATVARRSDGVGASHSLLLRGPDHEASLSVLVVPLSCAATSAHVPPSESAAFVLASDPSEVPASLARALRESFGLTPAEARLVEGLVEGSLLVDTAERSGIRISTARSQLCAALSKVGVRRQAELVRSALSLAAAAVEAEEGR